MSRVARTAVVAILGGSLSVVAVDATAAGGPPRVDVMEPVADTSIFDNGGTSNGAGMQLFAGVTNAGGGFTQQRSPMRFDLGDIPSDAVVLEVSLSLRLVQAGGQAQPGDVFQLRRLLAPWGEAGSVANGGQGGPAQPGDATWNFSFFPDVAWAEPGGDLARTPSAETAIGVATDSTWTFIDSRLVDDVAGWLADPSSNHGWALMTDGSATGTARRFGSREGSPAAWPMLAVTWMPAAPPCPADLDGSGAVDFGDVLAVLAVFGACEGCPEDLDVSGAVDFADLLGVLSNFGDCPA